jgi:hypothetical protein
MKIAAPVVGEWYRRPNGALFEVVALDEDEQTIELQFFDGTIDEVEFDAWPTLLTEQVGAPEDWLGSMDMDPEDFTGKDDGIPQGWHDPLLILEQTGN